MRDPFGWSIPLGRLFGITIRVHVLFPAVMLALVLRVGLQKDPPPNSSGLWLEELFVLLILFVAVLLHEFGHCFGAKLVDGDAHEILLWPLGGLASVDVPHSARPNFIVAAAGPLTNILLCLMAAAALSASSYSFLPLLDPRWDPLRVELYNWTDKLEFGNRFTGKTLQLGAGAIFLARFFWVNWILALLNLILVGFPMDMGRMFQCALWPRFGYRQATSAAVVAGFITALLVGVYSVIYWDPLSCFLCLFIWVQCRHQLILLETGGEDALFGYDFSQGYTSLEREAPPLPRRRRPNVWQRWWQRRAARKLQREIEQREAEERRMDELLEKVQRQGLHALTDEERRFLTRVSAKYRNRQ